MIPEPPLVVVFIHGPAAAGKFTIGSIVAAATGLPLFHNHLAVDVALSLFAFGSFGFRNLRAEIWRAAFREAASEGRSFIFTFHPEATVEPALVDELAAIVAGPGGSMVFVELTCSHATVLDRLGMESRKRFGKLTDPVLYEKIRSEGGFDFPGLPESDIRIDTDSVAPADAAQMIVAVLEARGFV